MKVMFGEEIWLMIIKISRGLSLIFLSILLNSFCLLVAAVKFDDYCGHERKADYSNEGSSSDYEPGAFEAQQYDSNPNIEKKTLGFHKYASSITLSQDGRLLYSISTDKSWLIIKTWNLENNTVATRWHPTDLYPRIPEISPNGKYVLCKHKNEGNKISIIKIESDHLTATRIFDAKVLSAKFSPDSRIITVLLKNQRGFAYRVNENGSLKEIGNLEHNLISGAYQTDNFFFGVRYTGFALLKNQIEMRFNIRKRPDLTTAAINASHGLVMTGHRHRREIRVFDIDGSTARLIHVFKCTECLLLEYIALRGEQLAVLQTCGMYCREQIVVYTDLFYKRLLNQYLGQHNLPVPEFNYGDQMFALACAMHQKLGTGTAATAIESLSLQRIKTFLRDIKPFTTVFTMASAKESTDLESFCVV